MINKIKNLLTKTYSKTLFYREYDSPIRYGYKPEHRVKSYVKIQRHFDFKEGLRYSVTVPNITWCLRNKQEALMKILEHESIGMAKYNKLKEDIQRQDLFRTLDPDYKKKI
jgi:hypothetical protein